MYNASEVVLACFLLLVFCQLFFEIYLISLNMAHARSHRREVPEFFRSWIDQQTFEKSVDYTIDKGKFSLIASVWSAALIAGFLAFRVFGRVDAWIGSLELNYYVQALLFLFSISIIFSILSLPFSYYSTFVIEKKYNFNKSTLGIFALDFVKGILLSILLGSPILLLILWFMRFVGQFWWVWGFVAFAGFQLIVLYIYPTLIAPIFNKFTPLMAGELKDAIENLAKKLAFEVSGIFLMDGSKRSSHGNAYFTGFGKKKRIVMFDTLIEQLSKDQALAVLAHEIGHEKKGHVKRLLAVSLLVTFVGFWALSQLISYQPLYSAFGFSIPSDYAILLIVSFLFSPIMYFVQPLFSSLSRRYEYEADAFSVNAMNNSKPLIDALLSISKKSLSNLVPHPLFSFFHYSHPTLQERINAMQDFGKRKLGASDNV